MSTFRKKVPDFQIGEGKESELVFYDSYNIIH